MGNWSKPVLADAYADVLTFLDDRLDDAGTLFLNAPSNQPTGSIRYLRASNKFQEWDGAAWVDKVLAVAGGGTGGATAADARTSLGIGTMGVQNSNSVTITGGSITGLSTFTVTCNITFTSDDAYDLGTNSVRPRKGYFRSAFVIPVGTDKYATS